MSDRPSHADYWDTVESIAREVIKNNGTDESNWHDSIHENVDGNGYIIYYSNNETVLDSTNNEPDPRDVAAMLGEEQAGDWRAVRMTAAYLAMEADVQEKCRELADEYFECDGCGETKPNEEAHDLDSGRYCNQCVLECSKCGNEFSAADDCGSVGAPLCRDCEGLDEE